MNDKQNEKVILIFQSTHPSWGATKYNQKSAILEKISIHAPIVGCDVTSTGSQARFEKISIHAPIVGCDKGHATGYSLISLISIHAPIVGCDALKPKFPMVILYFNPRTHRGVRLYVDVRKTSQYDFNPRTHRGVRLFWAYLFKTPQNFNPRTHRGVRPWTTNRMKR